MISDEEIAIHAKFSATRLNKPHCAHLKTELTDSMKAIRDLIMKRMKEREDKLVDFIKNISNGGRYRDSAANVLIDRAKVLMKELGHE